MTHFTLIPKGGRSSSDRSAECAGNTPRISRRPGGRRRLILGPVLAALVVVALVGARGPSSSAAGSSEAPTATPVRHLVVIFSENRSFDHYFGMYPNAANPPDEPPFVPDPETPAVDGLTPVLIANNPNLTKPFRLDPGKNGLGASTCSSNHQYRPEQRAVNAGLMNRFVQATGNTNCVGPPETGFPSGRPGGQVMGYFDGNTVTGLWSYAQAFALNDRSFGTVYGPSTPGALNLISGDTTHARALNRDGSAATLGSVPVFNGVGTAIGDPDPFYDECSEASVRAALTGRNIGDLLNDGSEAGGIPVTWGWFEGGFTPTLREGETIECKAEHLNLVGNADEDYEPHHEPFQYYASTSNPLHLPPSSVEAIGHTDEANHQYDLTDFWAALEAHEMPAVSFLKARGFEDGHPGPRNSDPLNEQHFIVDAINRVAASPEWATTAIVIAYDDSDGIYDHVFPPNVHSSNDTDRDGLYPIGTRFNCMPSAAQGENAHLRCGYGPRIPLLVISPFARPNFVDHTLTDQTSILRFIEENWSLGQIGGESFDDEAGTIQNMFEFAGDPNEPLFLQPCTGLPNRLPAVDSATVSPAGPRTNDVLQANAVSSDADATPDLPEWPCPAEYRDSLSQAYQWQRDTGSGWQDIPGATQAALDLSQAGAGDKGDLIRAVVTPNDGIQDGAPSTTDPVTVANTPPTVSVDPEVRNTQYSDPIEPMDVESADDDGDIPGLSATGLPAGVALHDGADGTGVIDGAPTDGEGSYDATVLADDGEGTGTANATVHVAKEAASVGYEGGFFFSTGSPTVNSASVTLGARVVEEADGHTGDLRNGTVSFALFRSGNLTTKPDLTVTTGVDASGRAEKTLTLPADNWTVVPGIASNQYYAGPDGDEVVVTVAQPIPGTYASGGGWVVDPSSGDLPVPISFTSDHGNFGFTVSLDKDGRARGHSVYVFRGADGYVYLVKSTSWQGGGLAVAGSRASFVCRATVIAVDPATGLQVAGIGGGAFTIRVDVTDAAASDGRDTFALAVYAQDGSLYHRVGTPSAQLPLQGGQIKVHTG